MKPDGSKRVRILFITFEPGLSGPQRWLEDLMKHRTFLEHFEASVWHIEDCYRGVRGKWRLVGDCRRMLSRHQSHLIYVSHDLNVAALVAPIFRLLGASEVIVHSHNSRYYEHENSLKPVLYRCLVRAAATRRIAVSQRAALAMFGASQVPWAQVPAFIDFERLWLDSAVVPTEPGEPRLLTHTFACVGRLCEQKNQELAIRALAKLRETGLFARLILLGEGDDKSKLVELCVALGVVRDVEFIGNTRSIAGYYRHVIDTLVVPSRFEGQGRMVAEAQLFGLPAIVSNAVPDSAFLSPANVIRVTSDTVEAWSYAMAKSVIATPAKLNPDPDSASRHPVLAMDSGIKNLLSVLTA